MIVTTDVRVRNTVNRNGIVVASVKRPTSGIPRHRSCYVVDHCGRYVGPKRKWTRRAARLFVERHGGVRMYECPHGCKVWDRQRFCSAWHIATGTAAES